MKSYWSRSVAGLASLGAVLCAPGLGCDPSLCPPGLTPVDSGGKVVDARVTDKPRSATDGTITAKRYTIELTGVHSHIYKVVSLLYTVRDLTTCTDAKDLKTCPGVPGLPVVAFSRLSGAATVEQGLEKGKLDDNGDGTYTQTRFFSWYGAYVVGLKLVKEGQTYLEAFPYETSRAGGEKYFCDIDRDSKDDLSFQIRWNAGREVILADEVETSFSLELMRSSNSPIDVKEPWKNTFDHLIPKQLVEGLPTVRLMADKGPSASPVATLTPVYKGKGIYEVKRKFSPADLGGQAGRTFWLEVSFKDELGCEVKGSLDPEEYYFLVSAKK